MQNQNSDIKDVLVTRVAAMLNAVDPHIAEGLKQWTTPELRHVANILEKKTLVALALELLASRLPDSRLPLRVSRYPFEGCSRETVERIVVGALTFPEKEGDLSALVLESLGLERKKPKEYFLVEAHFNITDLDSDLFNRLVSLGFEPDNFFKLQPKCYKHNLTLAFSVSRKQRGRFDYLRGIVAARSQSAAELVQNASGVSGFFESEVYPSSWIKKYQFKPSADHLLAAFPFSAGSFKVMDVPRTAEEVHAGGLQLESRKLADVHVKIPTEVRIEDYPEATHASVISLRKRLLDIGFYEIVSESGNAIYTGQFMDSKEAIEVFRSLDAYATTYGGFLDLVCEPCTAFWRKQEESSMGSARILAEVSPILSLC